MEQPAGRTPAPQGGGFRVGTAFGVPILVAPSTLLLVLVIAMTYGQALQPMLAASRAYTVAVVFAVLLIVSVFLHELGHCLASLGVGIGVRSITLYMLGGVTAAEREAPDPARAYLVTLAGPLVSLLLAATGAIATSFLPHGTVIRELVAQVTIVNAIIAGFNLLPGLPLDGGNLLRAGIWRLSGDRTLATRIAAWAGRGLAAALAVLAVVALVIAPRVGAPSAIWLFFVALFMWTGAGQALRAADISARLPRLSARHMARPVVTVDSDTPLAEALRRLAESRAGGIVLVDSAGRPDGVVVESQVTAIPEPQRPWVAARAVARPVAPGLLVQADLVGHDLLAAMQDAPASEYVVVGRDGTVVGVLVASDVAGVLDPATSR